MKKDPQLPASVPASHYFARLSLSRRKQNKHRRLAIRVLREKKEAPREIQRRVARAGGCNCFGEPNFRVVWGWSRLTWIGGRWVDRDAHGNFLAERVELRRVPKYLPFDRWHLERWLPPEAYGSPQLWYAQTIETEDGVCIPALGPFPRRGEYEHCFTLQGPRGEFIPLSPAACEHIVRAILWARRQPSQASRRAIFSREQKRDGAWNSAADALLDDAGHAFHGQPFIAAGT